MTTISLRDQNTLERLFGMSGGGVMDLNNKNFDSTVSRILGRSFFQEPEYANLSKAKKLRQICAQESPQHVGLLLLELLDCCEDYHKNSQWENGLTDAIKSDIERMTAKAHELAGTTPPSSAPTPVMPLPSCVHPNETTKNGKKYKVFISHASCDKQLADAFMVLLQMGLNVPYDAIYNTDKVDGQIPTEADFAEDILSALRDSEVAVFLITPTFLKKPNCLMEFGAALAYKTKKICFMALGITREEFSSLSFVIKEQNGYDIGDANKLYELTKALDITPPSIPRWNQAVEKFIGAHSSLL